jgi:uncharacterized protein involved in type VI secretion and phage assembly
MASKALFGKYRGTVLNNLDPMQIGRVQVSVPDVTGLAQDTWAMPCVPVAGADSGFFAVPALGAPVWIEFERGDLDHPIWVGGFWNNAADVPSFARAMPADIASITLQTPLANALTISDASGPNGGIVIRAATGAVISVSDAGITISNGKGAVINMTGPAVDVNSGALTVT